MYAAKFISAAAGLLLFACSAFASGGEAFLYSNGGEFVLVEHESTDAITMTARGRSYRMNIAVSASGSRYEAEFDPGTTFWEKGEAAYITLRGDDLGEFELARRYRTEDDIEISIGGESFRMTRVPSADGVRYEAVQDPTTSFEHAGRRAKLTVRGDEVATYVLLRVSPNDRELFLSTDGENFLLDRVPAAQGYKFAATDDPTTYFESVGDKGELVIRGEKRIGYDASPRPERSVEVRRVDFSVVPIGVSWQVTAIDGEPLRDGVLMTFRFDHNAQLSGFAGVNTFRASWVATRGRLLIEGTATTRMMGPAEFMEAEAGFLQRLNDAQRFDIEGRMLTIYTRDGKITAERM